MVKRIMDSSRMAENGESLFAEAATAMFYSDEEIMEAFNPAEAEEFIALRKKALREMLSLGYTADDDAGFSGFMAAESDETGYGVSDE